MARANAETPAKSEYRSATCCQCQPAPYNRVPHLVFQVHLGLDLAIGNVGIQQARVGAGQRVGNVAAFGIDGCDRIAEDAGLTLMTTLPTPARSRGEYSVGGVWGLVGQGYAGSLLFGPLVNDVGDGEVFERQSLRLKESDLFR